MNRSYFGNLGGIRGMAAVVVLFSHVVQVHFLRFTGLNTPLHQITSIASEYAVIIFFILSGYLIAHTLELNVAGNNTRLGNYAAARIARLYPPLLYAIVVSVAAFVVMSILGLPGRAVPLRLPGDLYAARDIVNLSQGQVAMAALLLSGMLEINGPLWSLYMEAKLYVLFACIIALCDFGRSLWTKLVLSMVFFLVAVAGIKLNPGFAGYSATWCIGALAYYLWNEGENYKSRILVCGACIIGSEIWHIYSDGVRTIFVVRDMLIALLIAWLMFKRRIRVPGSKILADCSYSLYITHFPVLLFAQSLLIFTGSTSVGAAMLVAIMSSAASFGVAFIGGAIEAKKTALQNALLALVERLHRLWRNLL